MSEKEFALQKSERTLIKGRFFGLGRARKYRLVVKSRIIRYLSRNRNRERYRHYRRWPKDEPTGRCEVAFKSALNRAKT